MKSTLFVRIWYAVAAVFCLVDSMTTTTWAEPVKIEPLIRVVDLNVGESSQVELANGQPVTLKLLDLREQRGSICNAVRRAEVTLEVNGEMATLVAATYRLPVSVGGVQVDCAVTKGYISNNIGGNVWALDKDVRLRLWPTGSSWVRPGTFGYPLKQRWLASYTDMANVPVGEKPGAEKVYYHAGLDFGGADGLVEVVSATEGVVVSVRGEVLQDLPSVVQPGLNVVYIRDGRGWYYRYSHLDCVDEAIQLGQQVSLGQKIGMLGKKGGSSGWSHLHFEAFMMQPSGRYGTTDSYAFVWQAYVQQHGVKLQAITGPKHFVLTDEEIVLDAGLSWSYKGPQHIRQYEWTFTDGSRATGIQVRRRYTQSGYYREILKVTDAEENTSYAFANVRVMDRQRRQRPPRLHATFYPTLDIKTYDQVIFMVRAFGFGRDEGEEVWDFGDGGGTAAVRSDANTDQHAKDGYAVTTHRFRQPGDYIVTVRRSNALGEMAMDRLYVHIKP